MADTEQAVQSGQLSAVVTAGDDIRVVTLAGEIDHHIGAIIRQTLDASGAPHPRVVVDMRQVASETPAAGCVWPRRPRP
ncbi:hypothetical protein [Streptomyces lavendofoliae]|uniref:hypothetical protein n=1 Tax=Streptomyces lavendofoliae TaxID=67314 RepID=UPI003D8F0407